MKPFPGGAKGPTQKKAQWHRWTWPSFYVHMSNVFPSARLSLWGQKCLYSQIPGPLKRSCEVDEVLLGVPLPPFLSFPPPFSTVPLWPWAWKTGFKRWLMFKGRVRLGGLLNWQTNPPALLLPKLTGSCQKMVTHPAVAHTGWQATYRAIAQCAAITGGYK